MIGANHARHARVDEAIATSSVILLIKTYTSKLIALVISGSRAGQADGLLLSLSLARPRSSAWRQPAWTLIRYNTFRTVFIPAGVPILQKSRKSSRE